jgi:hypothetical protein
MPHLFPCTSGSQPPMSYTHGPTHGLTFFLISFRLSHFQITAPVDSRKPLHVHTLAVSPGCATSVCCVAARLSIIPRTSTTRDVVTKRYARNALSKSSDLNRRPLIWFPNQQLVLTACKSISGWCTPRPLGGPGLAATVRFVFLFSPSAWVSESLNLDLSDASVMAGFSQGVITIVRGRGHAVTSPQEFWR